MQATEEEIKLLMTVGVAIGLCTDRIKKSKGGDDWTIKMAMIALKIKHIIAPEMNIDEFNSLFQKMMGFIPHETIESAIEEVMQDHKRLDGNAMAMLKEYMSD